MKFGKVVMAIVLIAGCNLKTEKKNEEKKEARVIANDTIPMDRSEVSDKPAAAYSAVVPDSLNKFEFFVRLYETPLRFRYLVKVRYKMMDVKDSVDIPNFGFQPRVEIRKLDNDLSCMIGFLDKDGSFKDLKKVEVVGKDLKIRQVKRYALGTVKKK